MKKIIGLIKGFCKREDGAGAVEYGLLIAFIAAVMVGSITFMGTSLSNTFQSIDIDGSDAPPADSDDHHHHD